MNTNKVWFITGAGSGIGAGTAKAALKAGDRVVATGRNLDREQQCRDCAEHQRIGALMPNKSVLSKRVSPHAASKLNDTPN